MGRMVEGDISDSTPVNYRQEKNKKKKSRLLNRDFPHCWNVDGHTQMNKSFWFRDQQQASTYKGEH